MSDVKEIPKVLVCLKNSNTCTTDLILGRITFWIIQSSNSEN